MDGSQWEGMLGLRAEVNLTKTLGLSTGSTVMRTLEGELVPRDSTIGALWLPLDGPKGALRTRAGLSLPTGSASATLGYTPFSSGSVDPRLGVSGHYGGLWLVAGDVEVRKPLYKGSDDVLQGTFTRSDLKAARRLPQAVTWAGLSYVNVAPTDIGWGLLRELSAVAGGVWTPNEAIGLSGNLRIPISGTPTAPYDIAIGLGITWVTGGKDGDDHHGAAEPGADHHGGEDQPHGDSHEP